MAIGTTLASAIRQDGTPRRGAIDEGRRVLFSKPAEGKQGRIQNSLARAVGLVWWCWRAKPEVGGPTRPHRILSSPAHAKSREAPAGMTRKCSGSLASQMGLDAQLCCCSGVRTVSARFARFSKGRWRCPHRTRCGRRPPFRLSFNVMGSVRT